MENLSRCHREKSGKRLLPHSTYILQHKNDIVKNNKYAETVVFCFIKPKKRKINNSVCRKSMFFQKKCLFSIPIRTLCGLCVLQSLWAFYLGILAETSNYITGATAPSPCRGLRPFDPIFINDRGFSTDWHAHNKWACDFLYNGEEMRLCVGT